MLHDLTGDEKLLAEFMSQISEDCYGAGWQTHLEYILWDAVTSGPRDFGQARITQNELDELIRMSNATGTWIIFDDQHGEVAIPLEKWKKKFADEVSRKPEILHA